MTTDYARARRHLARRDPVIRDLMRAHGKCGLADAQHGDPFGALMKAIVSQQLSTKAADTIFTRLIALFDGAPTPRRSPRSPTRSCAVSALSGQKLRYMRDLGGKVHGRRRCRCTRSTR
jgi:DNA-3-methyladenine glycosylase II